MTSLSPSLFKWFEDDINNNKDNQLELEEDSPLSPVLMDTTNTFISNNEFKPELRSRSNSPDDQDIKQIKHICSKLEVDVDKIISSYEDRYGLAECKCQKQEMDKVDEQKQQKHQNQYCCTNNSCSRSKWIRQKWTSAIIFNNNSEQIKFRCRLPPSQTMDNENDVIMEGKEILVSDSSEMKGQDTIQDLEYFKHLIHDHLTVEKKSSSILSLTNWMNRFILTIIQLHVDKCKNLSGEERKTIPIYGLKVWCIIESFKLISILDISGLFDLSTKDEYLSLLRSKSLSTSSSYLSTPSSLQLQMKEYYKNAEGRQDQRKFFLDRVKGVQHQVVEIFNEGNIDVEHLMLLWSKLIYYADKLDAQLMTSVTIGREKLSLLSSSKKISNRSIKGITPINEIFDIWLSQKNRDQNFIYHFNQFFDELIK